MVEIRAAEVDDAEGLVVLNERLSRETSFMLMEPSEVPRSVEGQQQSIGRIRASANEHLLVAVDDGRVVGFAAAHRRRFRRVRHCCALVVGVEQSHWGRGIGRRLMDDLEGWARSPGATRLELTVATRNLRAVRLYETCGFTTEGTRRHSMRIDGQPVDELYMSKLL